MSLARVLLACACALLLPKAVFAQANAWDSGSDGLVPIPALTARVTDQTGTLNASERQALESKLAAWESSSGNQLAILLVPTTKPEPIEAYSIRVAEAWKIGRKGQDNGAIIVVAKDDRRVRIEVGYGLEGALTDAMSRRIIADEISPRFREGQFAAGLNAAVDRIIEVVGKGGMPDRPQRQAQRRGSGISLETILILLFVVVPVLGGILRSMFGKVGGATVGAGLVGTAAWFVAGSIAIAIAAAVIAWIVMLVFGLGGGPIARGGRRGGWGGPYIGGGWGGGGWGGGGGWSGGGGGFGGGGASGGW